MSDNKQPPVFLLDTMAFIFRAYHAMQRSRPMSTHSGLPTAATYVFVNMIQKLRADFAPLYCAAVFDLSGEVFRDQKAREIGTLRKWSGKEQAFVEVEYAGYKANREAMPEDLVRQLPYIRRSIEAMRIPILEAQGFEADDLIGTLARQAAEAGHRVFIVSGDKDMMQLVTDHIHILNPQKDNLILDPEKVVEVLGVPPAQVIDVMALRGDAVDNIPGAPGIGDKGSVDLIRQFGSVEAVLDQADQVSRKSYRESLQNNRETILLSKELVTIDRFVPLALDLEAMKTTAPDHAALRELYTELEFTSLLRELDGAPDTAAPVAIGTAIERPQPAEVEDALAAARHGFCLVLDQPEPAAPGADDDGSDLPPMLTLLDLADRADQAFLADQADKASQTGNSAASSKSPHYEAAIAVSGQRSLRVPLDSALQTLLAEPSIPKIVHDWKTVLHHLDRLGLSLAGPVEDTMLISYALNPTHTTQTLADVAARAGLAQSGASGSGLAARALAVQSIFSSLSQSLSERGLSELYRTIDLPLVPVLFAMEQSGVRIDLSRLAQLSDTFGAEISRVSEAIFDLAGRRFNINSPKQLGEVLFVHLGLPKPALRGKGKVISTAQNVLEELAENYPIARLVTEFRHLAKLKSNYIDALPLLVDSSQRLHTTFNAAATATGRLSSTNPNLQNIPIRTQLGREIRAAFIPAPGYSLLSADYSQIELRLMAHFSQDPLLIHAYTNNIDIHTLTASEVFGVPPELIDKETRSRAKAVNFGIVYGISPFGLAAQLGIGQQEARAYIDRYFARYQGVHAFIESTVAQVRCDGFVRTLFGRIRPIPDIESRNANQRGFAERTAVNTPLQGTAADLIKLAMIRIHDRLSEQNLRTRMLLQVHDELVFEVPDGEESAAAALVQEAMENVVPLAVPLVADLAFGQNWRDVEEQPR